MLAYYPAIFGHLVHLTMVAEAPDQHGGGLGRLEDGKNGLNGINIISSIICIHEFLYLFSYNYLERPFAAFKKSKISNFKPQITALEPKLQSVIAITCVTRYSPMHT